MSESHEKLEAVFAGAVELSGDARASYLEGACAGDPELRRQVERLLRSLDRAGTFLTQAAQSHAEGGVPAFALSTPTAPRPVVALTEKPGDQIGRYKLLEKLGEGGFGVVYMAEQREPVKRRVALKIIKVGMDTREVVARFEAERQALALMDHPNIARVLDGGATDNGRPYFVMELVRGIKFTDYCEQNRLRLKERLELFIQVCHAVQHAHQKGIIHRDLKPSNILVTLHDGVPVPKVIDFGIAKATQQELTEKTLFTQYHQFIGTPSYMSPEQAELSGLDIDTRSDIYSLGVLLYELLVGQPPFDGQALLKAGLDEMRRTLREVEPARPSTRLTQSLVADDVSRRLSSQSDAAGSSTDSRQRSRVRELIHQLRGDLDWIVMKCLEKDRARRYETANGLAADIRRHLSNEPVVARPPSALYRFQKMVRRNKLAFAAGVAVMVVLLAGLSGTFAMYLRARASQASETLARTAAVRERDRAQDAERMAAEEAAIAQAVNNFLRHDLLRTAGEAYQRDSLKMPANPNLTMVEALDRAARNVPGRFQKQPLIEAAVRLTIGQTYLDLGDSAAAIPHLERALDLRRSRLDPEADDLRWTMRSLASAYDDAGRHAEALPLFQDVLKRAQRKSGTDHKEVAFALYELGLSFVHVNRPTEAIPLLEEALRQDGTREGPDSVDVALSLNALASAHYGAGEKRQAIDLAEKSLQLLQAKPDEQRRAITLMRNLVLFYEEAGRLKEAAPLLEQALAWQKAHLGGDHPSALRSSQDLARLYQKLGRAAEAETLLVEAAGITRKLEAQAPGPKLERLRRLAEFLILQKRFADAGKVYLDRIDLARTAPAIDPKLTEDALYDYADLLYRQAHFADAAPVYRELVQSQLARLSVTNDQVVRSTASLGRLLADWAWAERDTKSEGPSPKAEVVERAREAERLLRESLGFLSANTNVSRGRLGDTTSRLGGAVMILACTEPDHRADERAARMAEAETLLLKGDDLMQQSRSIDSKHRHDARQRLVRLYETWDELARNAGHAEKAVAWKRKLAELDPKQTAAEAATNPEATP